MRQPAVYILTNPWHTVLYTGVTSNLARRIEAHRNGSVHGFSRHYQTHKLVYAELHDEMATAILREKRIKRWKRVWKIELIETLNPGWRDLSREWLY